MARCGSRPPARCWPRRSAATSLCRSTLRRCGAALATGEARADRPVEFALGDGRLRPSIETQSARGLPAPDRGSRPLRQHHRPGDPRGCRNGAGGGGWPDSTGPSSPNAKPGATLARQVADARGPATDVVVLGNHGLIVAVGGGGGGGGAAGVAQAEALLDRGGRRAGGRADAGRRAGSVGAGSALRGKRLCGTAGRGADAPAGTGGPADGGGDRRLALSRPRDLLRSRRPGGRRGRCAARHGTARPS